MDKPEKSKPGKQKQKGFWHILRRNTLLNKKNAETDTARIVSIVNIDNEKTVALII